MGRDPEFRLLGSLEVVEDGKALPLGSKRQRTLLCVLALRANEVVARDVLIDGLWGERPPDTAANALQVQVHMLRKRVGAERIATARDGYRLQIDPGELDLVRFERLLARGRSELASGAASAASSTFGEALALWRGPALADVAYEPFAQAEIARLEEARLAAFEERIEADLVLGRHHDLVPELEALVSAHPLRERLQGQLMLALYRAGRQADSLAVFRRARRVLREELGLEPGPELRELQQAILRQDGALRVEPPELRRRRRLPASYTPLVGRRAELGEVGALLRGEGVRLFTLTGPGGTGKTRLALQAAHELADVFVDGVVFVDLSHLRQPELVASAIAHVLGVHEDGEREVLDGLRDSLRDRRLLMLLDNFEVVDEAAPLLGELLRAAPELSLIVTSRVPLRISGEHVYRVPPLPPDEAVQLFVVRARAVAPGFRRVSEEAAEVAEICSRVDRLPLAIELAAARSRELAPAEMLSLLPHRLELASEGSRDLPVRQQTLRATIDWSYELLEPGEQQLFARLGLFSGGCTLEAAEAVCDTSRSALASLVSKSLLFERSDASSALRFSMLETVREYALEGLEASGDVDALSRRHAEHYARLAEAAETELTAPGEGRWLERLEEDHDNLRAALSWCQQAGAVELELRLAGALARFWSLRDHLREGRAWCAAALRHGASSAPSLRAKVLAGATQLALRLGDYEEMTALVTENLALARALGDQVGVAAALDRLATAASFEGDLDRSSSLYEESAAIYRALDHERGLAVSLTNLGCLALIQGDYPRATELSEEALELYAKVQRDGMPQPLTSLGHAALLQGRHEEALARFHQGLELARELSYTEALIYCLEGLAAVLTATNQPERAATLLGAAGAAIEATGVSLEPFERHVHEQTLAAIRASLGEEAFAATWEAGGQLAGDDAAALALTFRDARTPDEPTGAARLH